MGLLCASASAIFREWLHEEGRLGATRFKCEWGASLMDLDRLQAIETEQDGKLFILRTPAAPPPNIREAETVTADW